MRSGGWQWHTARLRWLRPGARHAAQLFSDQQTSLQTIFVKAVTAIAATEPGAINTLHRPQRALRGE